jgi:hypothetical protein
VSKPSKTATKNAVFVGGGADIMRHFGRRLRRLFWGWRRAAAKIYLRGDLHPDSAWNNRQIQNSRNKRQTLPIRGGENPQFEGISSRNVPVFAGWELARLGGLIRGHFSVESTFFQSVEK